jgi:hypothetical protein
MRFKKKQRDFAKTTQSQLAADGLPPLSEHVIDRDQIRVAHIADGVYGVTMRTDNVLHILEPTLADELGDALKQEATTALAMSQKVSEKMS